MGINIEKLLNEGYSYSLINQIQRAYEKGYDISSINKDINAALLRYSISNIPVCKDIDCASLLEFYLHSYNVYDEVMDKISSNPKIKTKLEKGIIDGINPKTYKYINSTTSNVDRLNEVGVQGLTINKDISTYLDLGYNTGQIEQIFIALEQKYNIEDYIDPTYDRDRLQALNLLFKYYTRHHITIDKTFVNLANSKITNKLMKRALTALKNNKDISIIFSDKITSSQIGIFLTAINEGLNIELLINKEFDNHQINTLMVGLRSGIDISIYNKPEYSTKQMHAIYSVLKYNKEHKMQINVNPILNSKITSEEMMKYFENEKEKFVL